MKNRLEKRLGSLLIRGEKALAPFLTAGYPDRDSTKGIILALEQGGADLVEIGMPFSDPLADGPVIQHSSSVALKNGMTLPKVLDLVRAVRKQSEIPLVLMGYLNPILSYGVERFFSDAAEAGVDGVILPELPLEEAGRYADVIVSRGLSQILLVTPTTAGERVHAIDEASSGFLYCVSTTGVTGGEAGSQSLDDVRRIKRQASKNPVLVGFGIAAPDQAASFAEHADGVVVGTALLKRLSENPSMGGIAQWAAEFKTALR